MASFFTHCNSAGVNSVPVHLFSGVVVPILGPDFEVPAAAFSTAVVSGGSVFAWGEGTGDFLAGLDVIITLDSVADDHDVDVTVVRGNDAFILAVSGIGTRFLAATACDLFGVGPVSHGFLVS